MGDEEMDDVLDDEGGEEDGGGDAGGGGGGSAPGGLSPMLVRILLIVLGVIAMFGISIFVSVFVVRNMSKPQISVREGKIEGVALPEFAQFDMGDFNQNTADTGVAHFVKTKIIFLIEKKNQKLQAELTQKRIIFRDMIGEMLSKKEYSWLQRAENRDILKEKIKNEVNSQLREGEVMMVLFDNYLVN